MLSGEEYGEKKLFETTEKFNRKVILEQSQLDNHIIQESGHFEMADDPYCIQTCVEDPDYIFNSSYNPNREVYFGKGKHLDYPEDYVKTIVDYSKPNVGYVVSAWVTDEVGTSIGGLKYEKTTSI